MESEKGINDRDVGEGLLRALAKTTPEALKTLQDKELDRVIVLLATVRLAGTSVRIGSGALFGKR